MRKAPLVRRSGIWGLPLCLAIAAAIIGGPACGENPLSPSGDANLVILLTDDVTDEVEKVNVYFTSVTAKPAGQPVRELTLELETNPIDILELDDRVTLLAAGVVEPGVYEFIHININEGRSAIVEKGIQEGMRIPSEEVKILGPFTVDEDHRTSLTLDFDANDSLIRLGNGEWLLRPVIVITGNNSSSR